MCPHGRITLCGMVSQYNAEVRPPGQPLLGDTEAPHDAGLPVVTFIHGGDGFSAIPDACELGVDLRLTPRFDAAQAEALLRGAVADLDAAMPAPRPTTIELPPAGPPIASRLRRRSPARSRRPPDAPSGASPLLLSWAPPTSATSSLDSASRPRPASVSRAKTCMPPTKRWRSPPSPPSTRRTVTRSASCSATAISKRAGRAPLARTQPIRSLSASSGCRVSGTTVTGSLRNRSSVRIFTDSV